MNKPSDTEELKKLAEEIDARYPEFGGVEGSMRSLAEQMSDREDMFICNYGSIKSVDPSRRRFEAVACKGRNRKGRK